MNQPTDFELTNAMHVMQKCTMRNDDGTRDVKPGLEMLAAAAGVELCRLRELRATWFGAEEMQLRTTLDKFIAECRLRPNAGGEATGAALCDRSPRP